VNVCGHEVFNMTPVFQWNKGKKLRSR